MSDPLRDLLSEGRQRLAHVPDPGREARILLAHAAGLPREALHRLAEDAHSDDALRETYAAVLERRAAGEPVSRIIGFRGFWRHSFRITPDVLDPRPDTETLVSMGLAGPFDRVLDLGTGSGCILLSLLHERSSASGLGTDISEAALDVARDNAMRLGLSSRATFARSDWFGEVRETFDLIVSNPPYIAEDEMASLPIDVAAHDPILALSPGGDGLGAVQRIAEGAGAHLRPGGRLLLEIGWRQGRAASALLDAAGFADVAVFPDLGGRDRVVAATWPGSHD